MATPYIIDDSTPIVPQAEPGQGRGLDLSARPRGNAYEGVAEPFPDSLLIPRSEWQARIRERAERKVRLADLCDAAGVPIKNQGNLGYCWVFSPTSCLEIVRAIQGEPPVSLSPASAGALIKNFRNVGGWGREALEWIVAKGVAPSSVWPDTALDRRYATADAAGQAMRFRASEWWALDPRNLDQVVSCLLRGIPVSAGLNWWGHQVTYEDPAWLDGTVAIGFRNSWGVQWGDKGRGILQGNRMLPDDAVAPRTALAA